MFETKEEAKRSCIPLARDRLGATVTTKWDVEFVHPERIQSLRAQITLSGSIDVNVEVETEEKRVINVEERAKEKIGRDEARVLRTARTTEIAQKWEAINKEQCLLTEVDDKAREIMKKKEERKLHHQLLTILLEVWSAWADLRTRVNRETLLKDGPQSVAMQAHVREIDDLMADGKIDVRSPAAAQMISLPWPASGLCARLCCPDTTAVNAYRCVLYCSGTA